MAGELLDRNDGLADPVAGEASRGTIGLRQSSVVRLGPGDEEWEALREQFGDVVGDGVTVTVIGTERGDSGAGVSPGVEEVDQRRRHVLTRLRNGRVT